MKKLLLFTPLLISISVASPDICASIQNPDVRLSCYDDIYPIQDHKSHGDNNPKVESNKNTLETGWVYSKSVSPVDDSTTYYETLKANDYAFESKYDGLPELTISCHPRTNALKIYLNLGRPMKTTRYFATPETSTITTRVDRQQALTREWIMGENEDANKLFMTDKGLSLDQFDSMLEGETLFVKGLSILGDVGQTTFNTRGMSQAFRNMTTRCK